MPTDKLPTMFDSFGQRLRELRLKKGLTQIELAKGIITPSMISQVESDRARPSYKVLAALASRLEVPLEQLLEGVHLELEIASQYKMALSMVRAREFKAAVPLLDGLLRASQHRIPRSSLTLELARCHLELGNAEEAEKLLNELYQLASAQQDDQLLAVTLLHLGKVGVLALDLPMALFHSERAWDVLQREEAVDPDLQVQTLLQLAKLHEQVGKIAAAVKYYEQALLLNPGDGEKRGTMYLRLAEMYDCLKKYEQAEEYASKAALIFEEHANKQQRFEMQRRLILLQRGSDDWHTSVQQLVSLANQQERDGDVNNAGKIFSDLALLCFEHQAYEEACTFAEQAKGCLTGSDPALGNTYRVLSLGAFHREDATSGREYLDKAVKIFEKHSMVAALETFTIDICQYLNDKGAHQEAFERMERTHKYMITQLAQRGIVL
ncbi:helix-turn-helix domain-containing protein [Tumebacillus avium]|nr:transcriptional regulator [Tumebacillus avium]